MGKLLAFLRLGRLQFLVGGIVLHLLGVAVALFRGAPFDVGLFLCGQVAITSTQLAVHYSNDYFDLAADRANHTPTNWSGGSQVLPQGQIKPQFALWAALILSMITLAAAFRLAAVRTNAPLIFPLILLVLALSWAYSAPPLHLHSRGLGELTTALLVPGLTPLLGFYRQSGSLDPILFLAIFPLCCFQFAMLLTIEFPDANSDASVGKRTLVVRLGGLRAARLHNFVLLLAYISLPILVVLGLPLLVALALIAASPFAMLQGWRMISGAWSQPTQWNNMGFTSVSLLIGTAALELLAFVLLVGLS
jgi:1,4-dihydroxy-2-naphthoate polyprenyltransferase